MSRPINTVLWQQLTQDVTDAGHAFLWEKGHMIDLGALDDGNTSASAINDDGDVVGSAWLANQDVNRAFLWKNGVMTALEPLPGDSEGAASSINSRAAQC